MRKLKKTAKKHSEDIIDILIKTTPKEVNISNQEIINDYIHKKIIKEDLADFEEFASQFAQFNLKNLTKFYKKYPMKIHLIKKKKVYKKNLIRLIATHFYYKKDFEEFCNTLPKFLREILIDSVWKEKTNLKFYEKKYDLRLVNPKSFIWHPIVLFDEIFLFNILDNIYLIKLTNFLVEHLQKFVEKPKEMTLKYESKTENLLSLTKYYYKTDFAPDWILKYIVKFNENGFLQLTKTNKLAKKTIKLFKEQTGMKSFFEEDESNLTEKMLLIFLINFCKINKKKISLDDYKSMIIKYLKEDRSSNVIEHKIILSYINFNHYSITSKFRQIFISILKKLPIEKWISFSQIKDYSSFHSIDSDCYLDSEYADIDLKEVYDKYDEYVCSTHKINYDDDLIFSPLLKGSFFFFATLGIVEIAYDDPKNEIYTNDNLDYLTPFDGLRAVKLTKFGAFVLGITNEYTEPEEKKDKSIMTFSHKTLTIKLNQPDILKQMEISGFTKKLSPTVFEVNYKTMLDNCKDKDDLQLKIAKLKDVFGKKKHKIWIDFIADLEKKSKLINRKFNYKIFQLGNDKDLLNLITRDIVLRKLIYKAENKMVLVKDKNLEKFKDRLKEFGYFLK